MPKERKEFCTPIGRLVAGSCFEAQTKDHDGAPLVIKRGPNAGQPTIRYFMGLAIPKTDPGLPALMATIQEAARLSFPTLFDANGQVQRPDFAWKYKDGDSTAVDKKGRRHCDHEGYPGNIVFGFSGSFAPKCYGQDASRVLTDPQSIKRGFYVRILGSAVGNEEQSNPGVYLNYNAIQFVAFGEEMQAGPDATAAFNALPVAALPMGASATPLAPSGMPALTGMPAMSAPPVTGAVTIPGLPGSIPTAGAPIQMPGSISAPMFAGVTPDPSFTAPPPAPPAPGPELITIQGVAYTRDQLVTVGYNDAQIEAAKRGV